MTKLGQTIHLPYPFNCHRLNNREYHNRVGKNARDHRLIAEVGELLGDSYLGIDIFILIAGDGDFASLCEFIQERGRTVFIMNNKSNTAPYLRTSCDKHYYLEDLDKELMDD